MEAYIKSNKVIHPSYTIQYNDKAISNLKWNKKIEKRQRIRDHFKNGPGGVTMRWTPKRKVLKKIIVLNWQNKINLL